MWYIHDLVSFCAADYPCMCVAHVLPASHVKLRPAHERAPGPLTRPPRPPPPPAVQPTLHGQALPKAFDKTYRNPCWTDAASGKLRCAPYFQIIGVSKCGTTDLYNRLKKHHDLADGAKVRLHPPSRARRGGALRAQGAVEVRRCQGQTCPRPG